MEHSQSNFGLDQCHDCGVRRKQMTNPTSNYGWQMPTATDLVTDLPADFEVFGQAVDTSLVDLLGGTTGQVLSKTSATDMDFTWVAPNAGDITGVTAGTGISGGGTTGTVTVTNDMATTITTNGDLIYGTGSGTYTRTGIGSTGNVLTVSGGIPVWSAPAGGGKVLQVVQTQKTSLFSTTSSSFVDVTGFDVTITPSSASSKVLILMSGLFEMAVTGSGTNCNGDVAVLRTSTTIYQARLGMGNIASASGMIFDMPVTTVSLDSPSTTSAVTYKVQLRSSFATAYVDATATKIASIIAMEIGA